jgi:hypothetical protein
MPSFNADGAKETSSAVGAEKRHVKVSEGGADFQKGWVKGDSMGDWTPGDNHPHDGSSSSSGNSSSSSSSSSSSEEPWVKVKSRRQGKEAKGGRPSQDSAHAADALVLMAQTRASKAAALAHNIELNRQCVEHTWQRVEQRGPTRATSSALGRATAKERERRPVMGGYYPSKAWGKGAPPNGR